MWITHFSFLFSPVAWDKITYLLISVLARVGLPEFQWFQGELKVYVISDLGCLSSLNTKLDIKRIPNFLGCLEKNPKQTGVFIDLIQTYQCLRLAANIKHGVHTPDFCSLASICTGTKRVPNRNKTWIHVICDPFYKHKWLHRLQSTGSSK